MKSKDSEATICKAMNLLERVYKYETDGPYRLKVGGNEFKKSLLEEIDTFLHPQLSDVLSLNVRNYAFSNRIQKVFNKAGIITFGDLVNHTKQDLLKMRNMGAKCMVHIEEELKRHNLNLKQ